MKPQRSLFISLFLLLACLFLASTSPAPAIQQDIIYSRQSTEPDELQQAAFAVLEKHCNSCHQTEIPRRVFTEENMVRMAKKIYRQVFVSKRMPKGEDKRAQMTTEELATLRDWADTIRSKN